MISYLCLLLARFYAFFWTRFGGRPWTWISRDAIRTRPLLWVGPVLVGFVVVAPLLVRWLGVRGHVGLAIGFVVGGVLGHILWL